VVHPQATLAAARSDGRGATMTRMPDLPRFLTLADVAEVLSTSSAQVYALVRRGELEAIKIGGRGQWRIAVSDLEAYIQRQYLETRKFVDEHPFSEGEAKTDADAADVEPEG
jgi:excisionase family DNA binding protein